MRTKATKRVYEITLVYPSSMTRTVKIKAVDRQTAEKRALKFNPAALHVQRS
jgi:hypothetical protein